MSQILSAIVFIGLVTIMSLNLSVDKQLHMIDQECTLLEEEAPPYIWGGYWGRNFGGDCSGQMYDIAGKVIGAKRTTAYRMWIGFGNWGTNNIEGSKAAFDAGEFPSLVFFNYDGKMAAHVGMWRVKNDAEEKASKKSKRDTRVFAEASSSYRYFKRTTIARGDGRYRAILGTKKLDLNP